jgi:hypothetical protein
MAGPNGEAKKIVTGKQNVQQQGFPRGHPP